MGPFGRLRAFCAVCKALWRYGVREDMETYERWLWNREMFNIRIDIETVDKYLGGKSCWDLRFGFFTDTLKNGEAYGSPDPLPEDMAAIAKAWFEDDLYGSILRNDPGVLAEVRTDAVQWFGLLVDSVVKHARLTLAQEAEHSDRVVSWSGYTRDDFDWRED